MKRLLTILLLLAPIASAAEFVIPAAPRSLYEKVAATHAHETAVRFSWSPYADHQAAAVVVKAGSSMGSGTFVQFDNERFVLTCKHVTAGSRDGTAEIRFQDGRRVTGTCSYDKDGNDLAVVIIPPTTGVTVPVATVVTDARVEVLGFGGPRDILRHWNINRTNVSGGVASYDGGVAAGDSGGGILDMSGAIVGVMTHGTTPSDTDNEDRWRTHAKSGGPYLTPIRSFLGRVADKIRTRQLCPPNG